ncbi:DUF5050 domain-containing protein [Methanosarcina sp.]|uniref:TolB family protein n=1 Tax=Methanosarcina sp. TaxID=2213 RepID=UPI002988D838|nr:DUF5050 domain-containing protein [Methanosarcina sp.]MDW5549704.1 DUF5050 domain-containing protein [Methanosarcina sp.]MDW5552895.1 DUF5050 domain-containing protein [Methanosarcina sp.]MDW5558091.1 DUF5050 domain-containing protein [Methanosarcina sp.]
MPRILKINLLLILLILSMPTGFAASSENFSVGVEKITSISQIVKPYFDKLMISSGTNLKEQPVIRGSWSPDSNRLIVEASISHPKKIAFHGIYIMNADGSGIRELASTLNNTKEKSLSLHILSWSPDGNRITIFSNIFDIRDFYIFADPEKTLIKTAGRCNYTTVDEIRKNILDIEWQNNLMWNPEGTKALALMDQDTIPLNYQLYLLDSNGLILQQLTDVSNNVGFALWSHDGKKIAYSATGQPENENGLWTVNENGTVRKRLNDNGILVAWNPDDSRIFYFDENFSLCSIKVDGTDKVQLSKEFSSIEDVFEFSKDGKKLIFSAINSDKVTIYIAESTGKNVKALQEFPGYIIFKPSWSPKGDKIAFTQDEDLYTINPDGSEKSLIASTITDYEWHPSGEFISFVSSGSVFAASPDGSTKIKLAEDGRFLEGWSPDGSRLLVSQYGFTGLFIIKLEGYEGPLSIDFLTPVEEENCQLRVRCMSEPIADALLTLNGKEIGLTNSSGFLNYSFPDEGRCVINASKTGYRSASKVLVVQENSSASPVRSAVPEPSSDSGNKNVTRSETQIPGFRGITIFLILAFFVLRRSSL